MIRDASQCRNGHFCSPRPRRTRCATSARGGVSPCPEGHSCFLQPMCSLKSGLLLGFKSLNAPRGIFVFSIRRTSACCARNAAGLNAPKGIFVFLPICITRLPLDVLWSRNAPKGIFCSPTVDCEFEVDRKTPKSQCPDGHLCLSNDCRHAGLEAQESVSML